LVLPIVGDTLFAMEIMQEGSKDPYKKYGYDFSGHCYGCDVADILISDGIIYLINFEPRLKQQHDYTTIINDGDKIIIPSKNVKFTFEKINDAPIYKLTVDGTLKESKLEYLKLRMGTYYTTRQALSKFEVRDCGDFDG